ncbi:hypothetical protein PR048_016891 [Dryococelus australis]|uniref:Uncharacterized protein n=1 Tax=Dryococelus australis TaxID=614101 RepID=A0ABQ9H822_9NEOP|nr:hypothetical protein PR048_016891 [Dryococelus australis]
MHDVALAEPNVWPTNFIAALFRYWCANPHTTIRWIREAAETRRCTVRCKPAATCWEEPAQIHVGRRLTLAEGRVHGTITRGGGGGRGRRGAEGSLAPRQPGPLPARDCSRGHRHATTPPPTHTHTQATTHHFIDRHEEADSGHATRSGFDSPRQRGWLNTDRATGNTAALTTSALIHGRRNTSSVAVFTIQSVSLAHPVPLCSEPDIVSLSCPECSVARRALPHTAALHSPLTALAHCRAGPLRRPSCPECSVARRALPHTAALHSPLTALAHCRAGPLRRPSMARSPLPHFARWLSQAADPPGEADCSSWNRRPCPAHLHTPLVDSPSKVEEGEQRSHALPRRDWPRTTQETQRSAGVIKPEATYGSERLTMNKKGELRELGIKRKNKDLYRNSEKITDAMRERRLKFYGHLKRMNGNRLTKKIFNYIAKLKWTTGNRENIRRLINNTRFPEDRPKPGPKRVWTEEQRRVVGENRRKFWERRRRTRKVGLLCEFRLRFLSAFFRFWGRSWSRGSPPTKAARPLQDFRKWKSCRTMPLARFPWHLPFTPSLHSGTALHPPHFTVLRPRSDKFFGSIVRASLSPRVVRRRRRPPVAYQSTARRITAGSNEIFSKTLISITVFFPSGSVLIIIHTVASRIFLDSSWERSTVDDKLGNQPGMVRAPPKTFYANPALPRPWSRTQQAPAIAKALQQASGRPLTLAGNWRRGARASGKRANHIAAWRRTVQLGGRQSYVPFSANVQGNKRHPPPPPGKPNHHPTAPRWPFRGLHQKQSGNPELHTAVVTDALRTTAVLLGRSRPIQYAIKLHDVPNILHEQSNDRWLQNFEVCECRYVAYGINAPDVVQSPSLAISHMKSREILTAALAASSKKMPRSLAVYIQRDLTSLYRHYMNMQVVAVSGKRTWERGSIVNCTVRPAYSAWVLRNEHTTPPPLNQSHLCGHGFPILSNTLWGFSITRQSASDIMARGVRQPRRVLRRNNSTSGGCTNTQKRGSAKCDLGTRIEFRSPLRASIPLARRSDVLVAVLRMKSHLPNRNELTMSALITTNLIAKHASSLPADASHEAAAAAECKGRVNKRTPRKPSTQRSPRTSPRHESRPLVSLTPWPKGNDPTISLPVVATRQRSAAPGAPSASLQYSSAPGSVQKCATPGRSSVEVDVCGRTGRDQLSRASPALMCAPGPALQCGYCTVQCVSVAAHLAAALSVAAATVIALRPSLQGSVCTPSCPFAPLRLLLLLCLLETYGCYAWFRAGLEIEIKICLIISTSHFGTKIDESEIQNNVITLVQHFYIGSKIKLDTGSELGSFYLGSRKILVQPGISGHD